jgi:hypothetical protein
MPGRLLDQRMRAIGGDHEPRLHRPSGSRIVDAHAIARHGKLAHSGPS